MRDLLLLNLAATLFMTGLAWFVQIVHYPSFRFYKTEGFAEHQSRTGYVVAVPMLVELGTSLYLVWLAPRSALLWCGAVLVILVWLSTGFIQIPKHEVLLSGYDAAAHDHLVRWNWPRTLAWTVRSGIMFWAAHMIR